MSGRGGRSGQQSLPLLPALSLKSLSEWLERKCCLSYSMGITRSDGSREYHPMSDVVRFMEEVILNEANDGFMMGKEAVLLPLFLDILSVIDTMKQQDWPRDNSGLNNVFNVFHLFLHAQRINPHLSQLVQTIVIRRCRVQSAQYGDITFDWWCYSFDWWLNHFSSVRARDEEEQYGENLDENGQPLDNEEYWDRKKWDACSFLLMLLMIDPHRFAKYVGSKLWDVVPSHSDQQCEMDKFHANLLIVIEHFSWLETAMFSWYVVHKPQFDLGTICQAVCNAASDTSLISGIVHDLGRKLISGRGSLVQFYLLLSLYTKDGDRFEPDALACMIHVVQLYHEHLVGMRQWRFSTGDRTASIQFLIQLSEEFWQKLNAIEEADFGGIWHSVSDEWKNRIVDASTIRGFSYLDPPPGKWAFFHLLMAALAPNRRLWSASCASNTIVLRNTLASLASGADQVRCAVRQVLYLLLTTSNIDQSLMLVLDMFGYRAQQLCAGFGGVGEVMVKQELGAVIARLPSCYWPRNVLTIVVNLNRLLFDFDGCTKDMFGETLMQVYTGEGGEEIVEQGTVVSMDFFHPNRRHSVLYLLASWLSEACSSTAVVARLGLNPVHRTLVLRRFVEITEAWFEDYKHAIGHDGCAVVIEICQPVLDLLVPTDDVRHLNDVLQKWRKYRIELGEYKILPKKVAKEVEGIGLISGRRYENVCGHCLQNCTCTDPLKCREQCKEDFAPLLPRIEYFRAENVTSVEGKSSKDTGGNGGSGSQSSGLDRGSFGGGSAASSTFSSAANVMSSSAGVGSGFGAGRSISHMGMAAAGAGASAQFRPIFVPSASAMSMSCGGVTGGFGAAQSTSPMGMQAAVGSSAKSRQIVYPAMADVLAQLPDGTVFCQLPNLTGYHCYANSSMECLGSCADVVERLRLFSTTNAVECRKIAVDPRTCDDISIHLENLLLHRSKEVDLLRAAVSKASTGNEFPEGQQCDAAQFFIDLVFPKKTWSLSIEHLFRLIAKVNVKCRSCGDTSTRGMERIGEIRLGVQHDGKSDRHSLVGLFTQYFSSIVTKKCNMCGIDQDHDEMTSLVIKQDFRYLLVQFERRVAVNIGPNPGDVQFYDTSVDIDMDVDGDFRFEMVVDDGKGVGDAVAQVVRFTPIAAIYHEPGRSEKSLDGKYGDGHYKAYKKLKNGKWLLTDDAREPKMEDNLPEGLKNIRLLILERIITD